MTIAPITGAITGQVLVKASLAATIAPITGAITGQVLVKASLSFRNPAGFRSPGPPAAGAARGNARPG
jgi:hypothetical protein